MTSAPDAPSLEVGPIARSDKTTALDFGADATDFAARRRTKRDAAAALDIPGAEAEILIG
jgi:hypothetical protein